MPVKTFQLQSKYLGNPDELTVFEAIKRQVEQSKDLWIIVWGYYYGSPIREGDILVLGPNGLLVLEVKGGQLHYLSNSGVLGDTKHPFQQVSDQQSAILEEMELAIEGKETQTPYVYKSVALPKVPLNHKEIDLYDNKHYMTIPTQHIIDSGYLQSKFVHWWKRVFVNRPNVTQIYRDAFEDRFGAKLNTKQVQELVSQTEKVFQKKKKENILLFEKLSILSRQLIIHGGVGTGKSYLALYHACHLACMGERVLFLTFNIPFSQTVSAYLSKLQVKPVFRNINSMSWIQLFEWLKVKIGDSDELTEVTDVNEYYGKFIPQKIREYAKQLNESEKFTALIIDEAQDHHTSDLNGHNWWLSYLDLLKQGKEAAIGIYLDTSQRAPFFSEQGLKFEIEEIHKIFPGSMRSVLCRSTRYTKQIFEYLSTLKGVGLNSLVRQMGDCPKNSDGEEVLHISARPSDVPGRVEDILKGWLKDGFIRDASDVLLIGPRTEISNTSLGGVSNILNWKVVKSDPKDTQSEIRYQSAYRVKGIDELAVIVFDMDIGISEDMDYAFFMACSRARQLLAVIKVVTG